MDAFRFTRNGTCRTIETLARRIGLSEDRALQGWNPSADASPEWMAAFGPPF
jgi:hypothetical protein